jgi:hypothetical protein
MRCTSCHRRIKADASYTGAMLGPVCAVKAGVAARFEPKPEKPAAVRHKVVRARVNGTEWCDPNQMALELEAAC